MTFLRLHAAATLSVLLLAALSNTAQAEAVRSYDVSTNCYGPCDPGLTTSAQSTETQSGVASASYVETYDGGAVVRYSDASGFVDESAGLLQTVAAASLTTSSSSPDTIAANNFVGSTSEIYDTITLSEATTIWLSGSISGTIDVQQSTWDYGDVWAWYDYGLMFYQGDLNGDYWELGGQWGNQGGWCFSAGECDYSTNDTFLVPVALPAGTTQFNAHLFANTKIVAKSDAAIPAMDASSTLDFGDGLRFSLIIPEGVTATSGSGLLPMSTVPLPAAVWLFAGGIGALLTLARRRQRATA